MIEFVANQFSRYNEKTAGYLIYTFFGAMIEFEAPAYPIMGT